MKKFAAILLLIVTSTTVYASEAVYRQSLYKGVKLGRNITGKIGAEFRSKSNVECSSRCSFDVGCVAYQYEKSSQNICHLVVNAAADDVQTFVSDGSNFLYKARIGAWSGPTAVIYRSFDTLDNLTLMEGNTEGNFSALVPGKLNMAVVTDHTQQRWVDLGDLSAACITIPDTCGPEGAAVALWVKLIETPSSGGVVFLTSQQGYTTTGFYFRSENDFDMLVALKLIDRTSFSTSFQAVGGTWIHMVLNYIGPEHGQGFRIYYNGVKLDGGNTKYSGGKSVPPSDGTVVVGKFGSYYSSVAIDELLFFNVKLTDNQIRELYNQSFP